MDTGELRLEERKIVLPPERHKTGKRTQEPAIIYLSTVAVQWLERAIANMVPGNPYVFPGIKPGRPIHKTLRSWPWIRREAGCPRTSWSTARGTFG